jgi:hypothetical protein
LSFEEETKMKYKILSLLFAFGTCVIPAHAGVIVALDSVTSSGGNGYLQLTLTNTAGSSAINVGGFSFGVSVANGSGVTFGFPSLPATVVDVVTSSNYIFAANSLFGPDISISGFGTTQALGSDNFDTANGGTVVNGGETYGLGRIYYNLTGGAPASPIAVTIDQSIAITSLSSNTGGAITIDTFTDGSISAASTGVPEPSTFVLLGGGLLLAGLRRWKSRS